MNTVYCSCFCHKAWHRTLPPDCACNCNKPITFISATFSQPSLVSQWGLMQERVNQLEAENKKLIAENEKLASNFKLVNESATQLAYDKVKLTEELEKLKAENKELKQTLAFNRPLQTHFDAEVFNQVLEENHRLKAQLQSLQSQAKPTVKSAYTCDICQDTKRAIDIEMSQRYPACPTINGDNMQPNWVYKDCPCCVTANRDKNSQVERCEVSGIDLDNKNNLYKCKLCKDIKKIAYVFVYNNHTQLEDCPNCCHRQ